MKAVGNYAGCRDLTTQSPEQHNTTWSPQMPKAAWCALREMSRVLRHTSHRAWHASKPTQNQKNSPLFLSRCLTASRHRAASYKLLLKMTFNWNDFFERWQKIFSSCCSPLWSCVWFCLVCTLSLVGFALCVCRTRLWDILLHWPRLLTNTVMWIKLHEIEAEQLEKGFEDFFKIWCRINWPPWTTMP